MAVIYALAVKTARITATRDHFANGTVEILDGSNNVLATFGLSASGGNISGAAWTLAFDAATVNASGTGTLAAARIKTAAGVSDLTGLTAGTSGTDIICSAASCTAGQALTFLSGVLTHA
jgi:hypothetical protein